MIEEPYRWVEAIANRREYIEAQLAPGSPIAALGYRDGILFLTVSQTRQKIFEVYDRIAMGAIGHPGDIERLRMAAIELASTEGFTRAAADVSLRRLVHYSLSPVMKNAFEQVYGAPYLARMLFAEVGERPEEDLFLRVEYDGEIATNGATYAQARTAQRTRKRGRTLPHSAGHSNRENKWKHFSQLSTRRMPTSRRWSTPRSTHGASGICLYKLTMQKNHPSALPLGNIERNSSPMLE